MGFIRYNTKRKKRIAGLLLIVMVGEMMLPTFSYALTSGPAQPEMKGFEAVGSANLVDPFTGDFSYNIPLLDIDGYPVSINYQAGASPDDEGSWVGHGWSLTPGALNRQMRGLPDDFNGSDKLEKETDFKDHITKGLTGTISVDFLGIPGKKGGKIPKKKRNEVLAALSINPSISIGVEYDNYRGIGTKVGINTGLSIGDLASSVFNYNNNSTEADPSAASANSNQPSADVSLSLSSSSMNGASAGVNFPILKKQIGQSDITFTSSIGFPYNSRSGLQGMSFSQAFNTAVFHKGEYKSVYLAKGNSFVSFASPSYTPSIDVPTVSNSFSASITPGVQIAPVFLGFGVSGYRSKQFISTVDKKRIMNGYGMLYAEMGKNDRQALMDFNREKDVPYSKEIQYLPVPVPTSDLFTATGQNMSGQYKIFRGSHGVFSDPSVSAKGTDASVGLEAGAGLFWDAGVDLFFQNTSNSTGKWIRNNSFLEEGDFQSRTTTDPTHEKAFFKKIGEPVAADLSYYQQLGNDSTIAVAFAGNTGSMPGTRKAFKNRYGTSDITADSKLDRNTRAIRNEPMSYLTAEEATLHAMDKTIKSYPVNQLSVGNCNTSEIVNINRTTAYRKKHHISEVMVTGKDGSRNVYGIPVYNTYQEDVTFSITGDTSKRRTGYIDYTDPVNNAANSVSRDKYYSRQTMAPYATSYLLTAVLSPDYVDVKGDGITDDDMGNAVKFNYHKLSNEYHWRTPYGDGKANYNEGMLSDRLDDKANYSYGKRESWYMHSIESKTMVAIFIVEDRDDALGVTAATGGINTSSRLKRLKEIRLFSKADVYAHNGNLSVLTPIKVVHFEYSYSLMQGLPNTVNGSTGKLTLKKIYFTYGNSTLGVVHPYSFEYNSDSIPLSSFHHKLYDRWGTYKNQQDNPAGLTNAEFPYTPQDKSLADAYVSAWQLKKINLPTGGSIAVTYEADDYAYVQNKRSMIMLPVNGIGAPGASGGLIGADELIIDIPYPVNSTKEFLFHYLNGEQYLYFKFYANLDNKGHYEFVPGYAKFKSVRLISSTRIALALQKENVEGTGLVNPIAHTAWQFVRSNLPKYAYPGYENLENEGSDLKKAILSLGSALSNLKELLPNSFGPIAKRRKYADNIIPGKSFIRLQSPTFNKIGGGHRVQKIQISDAWEELSATADSKTATYTQVFEYKKTIRDANGNNLDISSGVASYEPLLGGEENPFHQPVFYKKNAILQLDSYYYIEEPFCESLYPAPSVGYSQVTVKNIGAEQTESRTGKIVHEFYTAQDYPTRVDILPMSKAKYGSSKILQILASKIINNIALSQGYRIENNDMHGKPKAQSVFNVSGALISSVEYTYKTLNPDEENGKLNNSVSLLMPDGNVVDGVIGKDMELFTDMRESISDNQGYRIQASGGAALFFIFPIPFVFPGLGANYDHRAYFSSSTIKIIQTFAILDKVKKTENGSSITTENILWDGQTGDVLMTRTQNEFDDPVYQLNIPANWAYDAMGHSYRNEGIYLSGLSTNISGNVQQTSLNNIIKPGDEIIDLSTDNRYWVIYTQSKFSLIDRNGNPLNSTTLGKAKIVRSGLRNILSQPLCSYVTLKNPIVGGKLDISVLSGILSTQGYEYTDKWKVPAKVCATCPEGYTLLPDGSNCYKDTAVIPGNSTGCSVVCDGGHDGSYTSYGTYIYDAGYNGQGDGTYSVITGNSFWERNTNCEPCNQQNSATNLSTNKATVTAESGVKSKPSNTVQLKGGRTKNTANTTQPVTGQNASKLVIQNPVLQKVSKQKKSATSNLNQDSLNATRAGASTNKIGSNSMKNPGVASKTSLSLVKANTVKTQGTVSTVTKKSTVVTKLSSIEDNCDLEPVARSTTNCGPLDRTSIWSCDGFSAGSRAPVNEWIGFTQTISVPSTKTYYIGMAADNYLRFKIDGSTIMSKDSLFAENFKIWHIYPVVLTAGTHTIQMEARNDGGPASMGAEIYDNTALEIAAATSYCDLNVIFSTKDMIGQSLSSGYTEPSCPPGYTLVNTSSGPVCRQIVPSILYNPYIYGHLGNWRNKASYVFHSERTHPKGDPGLNGSTQIRNAGAFTSMVPLWQPAMYSQFGQSLWGMTGTNSTDKWVKATEVGAFNSKGYSIEEKNALNQYSSVLMGYLDSRPVAVASNSRFSELAYDGFEDYEFHLGCVSSTCAYDHFSFRNALNANVKLDHGVSHTGKTSLKINTSVTISKTNSVGISGEEQFSVNSNGLYMMNAGTTWDNGFTPVAGKKYVLSLWMKDNAPRNNTIATQIKVNGADIINNAMKWQVVEGWKRVDVSFTASSGNPFTLQIIPSGTIWIDDLRIAPFDAQVKSYAYDPVNLKLMAEMDENNFATFYEYDEEGTLIRVKKETERGVVTIKETRSSYRKN